MKNAMQRVDVWLRVCYVLATITLLGVAAMSVGGALQIQFGAWAYLIGYGSYRAGLGTVVCFPTQVAPL